MAFLGIHAWNPQKSPKELASPLLALISYNYTNPNTDLPNFSIDIFKSAKYHYEALTQEREIRVLVLQSGRAEDFLQCHLKHVSLDDPLPYEALSYVWGDPNKKDQIHWGTELYQSR